MSELLRKHIEIYNERLREGKLKNVIEFKEFDAQGMQVRFRISTACNANDDDREEGLCGGLCVMFPVRFISFVMRGMFFDLL
jgi:hypothetical protein